MQFGTNTVLVPFGRGTHGIGQELRCHVCVPGTQGGCFPARTPREDRTTELKGRRDLS